MNALVTGGAGFIGTNLVRKLVEDGDRVIVVDNLHSGSLDNLSDIFSEITFLQTTAGTIPRLDIKEPDIIFHLGIYSSSPMYKRDPSLCGKAINDAISLFNYAADHKIPVIYASSSSLYNVQNPPHHEKLEILPT